ncbi:MAG TPA: divergent polysaccharide deacetylase family protein [Thiotrichaceae bacterium]|jgi:polysaccharide deacetylase 2 family uncharacterized protein YibQ|nr:divergent polysaccharide deacetylase family protein [Thiotrichaceae bacterium]HIM07414.1 divergent polysaccharide deacetylase family protein [Gammaproteobacteria bacterium]
MVNGNIKIQWPVFYIDSLTGQESVAARLAKESNVPYLTRDIFLDHKQNRAYIRKQFMELVKHAKRHGSALGIGHPHVSTIEMLQDVNKYGVKFIGIKTLLKNRATGKANAQGTRTASAGM